MLTAPLSETELDKLYGALDSTRDNWANLAKKSTPISIHSKEPEHEFVVIPSPGQAPMNSLLWKLLP